MCYEVIYEGNCRYDHVNFTTRTKGEKTTDNLFFAEVKRMPGEDEKLVVSCTCMVDPFDNGILYSYQVSLKFSLNVFFLSNRIFTLIMVDLFVCASCHFLSIILELCIVISQTSSGTYMCIITFT